MAPACYRGGIVAWHDTVMIPGPYRVMLESVYSNGGLRNVGRVDSITYATVGDGSGLVDMLQRLTARADRRIAEMWRRAKRFRARAASAF